MKERDRSYGCRLCQKQNMRHDGSYRCLYSKTKQVDDKFVMQLRAQQGSRLKKGKKRKRALSSKRKENNWGLRTLDSIRLKA